MKGIKFNHIVQKMGIVRKTGFSLVPYVRYEEVCESEESLKEKLIKQAAGCLDQHDECFAGE